MRFLVYASGVNRGGHCPGDTGCSGCVPGATCEAHNLPERVAASKHVLRVLMGMEGSVGREGREEPVVEATVVMEIALARNVVPSLVGAE